MTGSMPCTASGFGGYYFTLGLQLVWAWICTGGMEVNNPTSEGHFDHNVSESIDSSASSSLVQKVSASQDSVCIFASLVATSW